MNKHFFIGIDEVGRGPLAGPVVVCALLASRETIRRFRTIKESKQLRPKKREEWLRKIDAARSFALRYQVAMVSAKTIDRIGIAPAIKKALDTALKKLAVDPKKCNVLLDGGLHAPLEYKKQKTIIRGDAKETVIAMASVVAKVKRDRLMLRLEKKYPNYHFAKHKGYGTALHIRIVKKIGMSEIHRRSFCKFLNTG